MSSLAAVVCSAGGHHFALEACRINTLRPYSDELDSISLHQLIPGLSLEPARFCLGWHTPDGQNGWLAVADEPQHLQLPLQQLYALPPALQLARLHPAIRALSWHLGQPLVLLDPRRFPATSAAAPT